jgi:hypothetical protein
VNDAPLAGLIIWALAGAGFTALGVYGLRHPDRLADFFRGQGASFFGKKVADRVYTVRNQRWALIMFVIVGPIFVLAGVGTIVARIVARIIG